MNDIRKVYITGHRNPDVDSISSAACLAILRRRQGVREAEAICPGKLPDRAKYLFERFGMTPPPSVKDVHLRIEDIMRTDIPQVRPGIPLLEAVRQLHASSFQRLPVVRKDGQFVCMTSPLNLLTSLLEIGHDAEEGLTGRLIHTSLNLIRQVLHGEWIVSRTPSRITDYLVYVAAMSVDSFEEHLPPDESQRLLVICGDRPEIHLRALQRKVGLLIVTGEREVEPLIIKEAKLQKVPMMRTPLDSATVIRRLRFSVPVEHYAPGTSIPQLTLNRHDRFRGLENRILNSLEDVIPVLDEQGKYEGAVLKRDVTAEPPYRLVMVDHNETEQSVPGAEEIPVIEVVDHHRIGMMPTKEPIRFTGDVVGSTCTLIAQMFKASGESVPAPIAGILLGGLITDTLAR